MKEKSQSSHFPESFYRVSVKGLCVRDGKLLLVKEPKELSGQWELPGGGLDFGENPRSGLEREIEEEMRLGVVSVSERPIYAWVNRFENRRGMEWYYSLVLGYRIALANFDFTPTLECEEIRFFTQEELQSLDLFHQAAELRKVFNPADFS